MNRIILLFSLLILLSCERENIDDCFTPTGKTIETHYALSPFSTIKIRDNIDVNFHLSNDFKAILSAGKNITKQITVESKDNQLLIEDRNTCNWVRSSKRSITLDVYCPTIEYIRYEGSGIIRFKNVFRTDTFLIDSWEGSGDIHLNIETNEALLKSHSGTANIYCEGHANNMILFNAANGVIDAQNMSAQTGTLLCHNTGWIKGNVSESAKVELTGSGDIYVYGQPSIELIKTGSGQLITE